MGIRKRALAIGVTTVLGILDKSGPLMSWAARQTAEAAVALYETDALRSMIDNIGSEGVIKAVTSRANWKRDEAAQLGSRVHAWADALVASQPLPSLTDTERAYAEHYAEWWQSRGWTLRLSEALVVAPALPGNVDHEGWGGTFDLLAYDEDGRTVLADIKTGKGIYREVILQLAAYGMAPLVSPMGSDIVYPMPKPDRYVVIHVTRDGVREVELSIGARDWSAWLSVLDVYRWTESVKGKL